MVLQFLPMIATGLQLLGGASAISSMFNKPQQTMAERAQLQALANQSRLLKTLTNPNDTIFKNLEAQEAQSLRNNTQMGLRDLLSADRRAQLLGRTSYFNPERRDESISRYLTNSAMQQEPMARSNALQRIMQAMSGYLGIGNQYGGMIDRQQQAQQQASARTPMGLMAGGDFLKSIPGLFGGGGQGGQFSNIYGALGSGW